MSTKPVKTDYVKQFEGRLSEIDKLQSTPDFIRQHAINILDNALQLPVKVRNYQLDTVLRNGKSSLENITKGSIAANFSVIYAQMCVLAVSSLEAILKKYFENAANDYRKLDTGNKKLKEIKVSLEDIITEELKFGGKIGKLILDKDKPSFQDLKSIKDVFKTYFGKEIVLEGEVEKRLCFYLEARHILVHKGGVVDQKFVQATGRMKANFKSLKEGDDLDMNEEDWESMKEALVSLVKEVTKRDDSK